MSDENKNGTFSDFEREAMRDRAKELKAEAKAAKNRDENLKMLTDAISKMIPSDQANAQKVHEIITRVAPQLMAKTWYSMPAWADAEGKAVVFFQPADKFKARYSTLGFNDNAKLDEGDMWATGYAITKITPAVEKKIEELVKKAA